MDRILDDHILLHRTILFIWLLNKKLCCCVHIVKVFHTLENFNAWHKVFLANACSSSSTMKLKSTFKCSPPPSPLPLFIVLACICQHVPVFIEPWTFWDSSFHWLFTCAYRIVKSPWRVDFKALNLHLISCLYVIYGYMPVGVYVCDLLLMWWILTILQYC